MPPTTSSSSSVNWQSHPHEYLLQHLVPCKLEGGQAILEPWGRCPAAESTHAEVPLMASFCHRKQQIPSPHESHSSGVLVTGQQKQDN